MSAAMSPIIINPLLANLCLMALFWLLSLYRRNAGVVDLGWPLMFVMAAWIWFPAAAGGAGHWLVLGLVTLWGLRLHLHLYWRNLGQPEDRRYRAIRANNGAGFWWKSLFIVFALQGVLAWLASWVIYGALAGGGSAGVLVIAGTAVAVGGLVMEAVADWQLARFKSDPNNAGRVLQSGLWRYSRHPNYFGECCFWWGIFLFALAAGAWWSLLSPVLMTVLLLKVSGVSLLEKDIGERRPAYRYYVQTTPAFIPGRPRDQP